MGLGPARGFCAKGTQPQPPAISPQRQRTRMWGRAAQGQGAGGKLIQVGIDRATKLGLPCYLESSNPKNVPFYERVGVCQSLILEHIL